MPPIRGLEPAQSTRRFRCSYQGCNAAFIKRAHLRRHEMTHTQRRDFVCPGCGRPFSRNDSMARHLRRKHPNLCQEQSSGRLITASTHYQLNQDLGPGSASSSQILAFPPILATPSTSRSYCTMPREPAAGCTDAYLVLSDPSNRARPDHYGDPSGQPSIKGDSGTSVSSASPQWQQTRFETSRDRLLHTSHRVNQYEKVLHSSGSGTFAGPSYSAAETDRLGSLAQPSFRHPWHPRSYPAKVTETSALSPASSSVRIGGLRYTPIDESEKPAHSSHADDVRFYGSANNRASDRDFDPIASQYLPDGGSDSFHQASPLDLFDPPQRLGPSHEWPSTSTTASYAFPSENVEIESGLLEACIVQRESAPSDAEVLFDSCQSPSAANSYFKVESSSFPDRERSSIFHDTDNVARFLSEIGLDLAFDNARPSSVTCNHPDLPNPSGSVSQVALEQRSYHIPPALSESSSTGCLAMSQWASDQGYPQDQVRSTHQLSNSASQALLSGKTSDATQRPAVEAESLFFSVSQGSTSQQSDNYHNDASQASRPLVQTSKLGSLPEEEDPSSFCMPHDLFRPPSIARDEEGSKIAASQESSSLEGGILPSSVSAKGSGSSAGFPRSSETSDSVAMVRGQSKGVSGLLLADQSFASGSTQQFDRRPESSRTSDSSQTRSILLPKPDTSSDLSSDTDTESTSLSSVSRSIATNRRSSVPTICAGQTKVSFKKTGDRFKAFARQCQAQLHPKADLLPCLEPLLPLVLRIDAPIFHPKMVGSQKAHTAEEILALFALTSVRSENPRFVDEGKQLASFLYGMVLLSFKLIVHMGEKSDAFIKCFLLVGMRAMRQQDPDFWHKIKQIRESVILDVTGVSNHDLDHSLDAIATDDVLRLKNEGLFEMWLKWYSHESRKRTILLAAILDSQCSAYFVPLHPCLTMRPEGPRCQFLFAHAYEPCPDVIFHAWPPEVWAQSVASTSSLPSSRGADLAFCRGMPKMIAEILSGQLLKRRVRRCCPERSLNAFSSAADRSFLSMRDQSTLLNARGLVRTLEPHDVDKVTPESATSSKRSSLCNAWPRARTVPQLQMYALLEAINGAWMSDSAWYRTPTWGPTALPSELKIDSHDVKLQRLAVEDLPGWRLGRSLTPHQVTHGLINWSEMFSTSLMGQNEANASFSIGLKLEEDLHCLMIRWQSVFLSLCAPMLSLCSFLSLKLDPSPKDCIRRERIRGLLQQWLRLGCGRRALVHASTILTLYHLARKTRKGERLGPVKAHALYSSIVVLTAILVLLRDGANHDTLESDTRNMAGIELVPVKEVWSDIIEPDLHAQHTAAEHVRRTSPATEQSACPEWSMALYWHKRFESLGLAGIRTDPKADISGFQDWISCGLSAWDNTSVILPSPLPCQRRGSLAEDRAWPVGRRDVYDMSLCNSLRRCSYEIPRYAGTEYSSQHPHIQRKRCAQDKSFLESKSFTKIDTDVPTSSATKTRQWLLDGHMHTATFCGLFLVRECQHVDSKDIACDVLQPHHLRQILKHVLLDKPMWCYSDSYTSLLSSAFDSLALSSL